MLSRTPAIEINGTSKLNGTTDNVISLGRFI
jgi:hypothetical protein